VLLIACTNLANLVLSRGASRRHEFAVRRALGAGRARLIREQLVEGAAIALSGGALGVVVTDRLMTLVATVVRDTFPGIPHLAAFQPTLSIEVLIAAGGFALLAFLVSSLVPAVQLTRVSDRAVLSSDTGAGALPRWRGRSNLIALQVAASVCLYLVTALGVTLLTTEFSVTERPGLGRAAVVEVPFHDQQRDEGRIRSIADRVVDDLRRAPGVTMSAVGSIQDRMDHVALTLPGAVSRPGVPTGESTYLSVATPELLRVTGVPIVQGREFTDRDGAGSPPVIIVSRGLAGKLFGTADPIGRHVIATSPVWLPGESTTFTVVGVVADQVSDTSYDRINRVSYVPFAQRFTSELAFFATGPGDDLGPIVGHLRSAIQRADPDIAVGFAGRADRAGMRWMVAAGARLATIMSGSLATIAIVLAMAGLFGVLSHVVSRRTRELGVRIALGADRGRIVRLILKDGFRPVVEGLCIGLGAAALIRISLRALFEEPITAFDPIAFALGAGPIVIAAAIACYLPARRAAKVDPNVALRDV
jgi:putative ABC transport system permease protein